MTLTRRGAVVWLTGLPAAGKTTIAEALAAKLAGRVPVEVLDGDAVRAHLSKGLGFSREDRDTNVARIAFVAHLLARNGVLVIVAAISPYRAARDDARRQIGDFVEVHVVTPLAECIARDPKGLYRRALAGELTGVTGIDDPYEPPLCPELTVGSAVEAVDAISAHLTRRGWLAGDPS